MNINMRQFDKSGLTGQQLPVKPGTIHEEMHVVTLYPTECGPVFEGLAGAATEAAVHTFYQMPADRQQELLKAYFGSGADYRFLRVSLDSCDFSIGHYEAMSDPSDTALSTFSLSHDETEIIPFIKLAEKTAGHSIPLLLSPWSPPAFMKTTGERNHGGKLKSEYYSLWAEYICKYIEGYEAHGLTVAYISVQNEPNATQTWDSCLYTGEEERIFVRDCLSPALKRHGLGTKILIWDHNKERAYERACETLKPDTRDLVEGVAFHFYTGDHFESLQMLSRRFPEKKLIFTEGCMEYSREKHGINVWEHAMRYAHEYIGDMRNGTTILFDWNIYLNQQGGPNHVANYCAAPVMCNTETKQVTLNPSWQAIEMLSKVAVPGYTQIFSSAWHPDIDTVAFKDGSHLNVALLNRAERTLPVTLRFNGWVTDFSLSQQSLTTISIEL